MKFIFQLSIVLFLASPAFTADEFFIAASQISMVVPKTTQNGAKVRISSSIHRAIDGSGFRNTLTSTFTRMDDMSRYLV